MRTFNAGHGSLKKSIAESRFGFLLLLLLLLLFFLVVLLLFCFCFLCCCCCCFCAVIVGGRIEMGRGWTQGTRASALVFCGFAARNFH